MPTGGCCCQSGWVAGSTIMHHRGCPSATPSHKIPGLSQARQELAHAPIEESRAVSLCMRAGAHGGPLLPQPTQGLLVTGASDFMNARMVRGQWSSIQASAANVDKAELGFELLGTGWMPKRRGGRLMDGPGSCGSPSSPHCHQKGSLRSGACHQKRQTDVRPYHSSPDEHCGVLREAGTVTTATPYACPNSNTVSPRASHQRSLNSVNHRDGPAVIPSPCSPNASLSIRDHVDDEHRSAMTPARISQKLGEWVDHGAERMHGILMAGSASMST